MEKRQYRKDRNYTIDFLKFIFGIVIIFLHFYHAGFMFSGPEYIPSGGGKLPWGGVTLQLNFSLLHQDIFL